MDANELNPLLSVHSQERSPLLIEVMPEFLAEVPQPQSWWRRRVPLILFIATCLCTFAMRTISVLFVTPYYDTWQLAVLDGAMYSAAIMTILLCHETGHYLQACRNRVHASLPYFLPFPLPPIGTFGAVILMEPRRGDRKAVFDIGISGPLAGLVPTLVFLCLGLAWSSSRPPQSGELILGSPLLVKWIYAAMHGPIPVGNCIVYHPIAFAGWVGLLITAINLMPIGQLDGGHILYGMFRRKANTASLALLVAAIGLTIWYRMLTWLPMLGLITFLGIRHPPTADDSVPLGWWRYALGLATLAFILVGFTPRPMDVIEKRDAQGSASRARLGSELNKNLTRDRVERTPSGPASGRKVRRTSAWGEFATRRPVDLSFSLTRAPRAESQAFPRGAGSPAPAGSFPATRLLRRRVGQVFLATEY